jgi:outer membrane protein OmpA-like peptidoglycan-associated protein
MKIGKVAIAVLMMSPVCSVFSQKDKKSSEKEILRMGFEKTKDSETPTELGTINNTSSILDYGVISPTDVPADLFSMESSGDVKIPNNVMGVEEPMKEDGGNNYAGICFYKPGKAAKERSYITIPIMKGKEQQTLKKGLTYCVEFSVSLAESSKFAVNNIAAHLSKEAPASGGVGFIGKTEKVMKGQGNKVYTGFFGWEKVCNIYTAKGDEKFITIGNFDGNEQTQFQQVKKPKDSEVDQLQQAYYYVDNVIIRLVDKPQDCPCYDANPQKVEQNYSTLIFTNNPEITDKMSLADRIGMHDVYFRFGKASFTDNAKEMMNYVVEQMKTNPNIRIEVQGNRDATEGKAAETNPEYEDMDRKRAAAVVKYLVAQGIDAGRLVEAYNGADIPNPKIAKDENDNFIDDQEVQDAKNRRVYFKVLK